MFFVFASLSLFLYRCRGAKKNQREKNSRKKKNEKKIKSSGTAPRSRGSPRCSRPSSRRAPASPYATSTTASGPRWRPRGSCARRRSCGGCRRLRPLLRLRPRRRPRASPSRLERRRRKKKNIFGTPTPNTFTLVCPHSPFLNSTGRDILQSWKKKKREKQRRSNNHALLY